MVNGVSGAARSSPLVAKIAKARRRTLQRAFFSFRTDPAYAAEQLLVVARQERGGELGLGSLVAALAGLTLRARSAIAAGATVAILARTAMVAAVPARATVAVA